MIQNNKFTFIFFVSFFTSSLIAQELGSIESKVIDAADQKNFSFSSIELYQNGVLKIKEVSDIDGQYSMKNI